VLSRPPCARELAYRRHSTRLILSRLLQPRPDRQVSVMISRHGTAGSDDPDESPGAAGDDDDDSQLVRLQPATLRQSPQGREAARGLHGGGPGTEMLSRPSSVDLQVRQ